MNRKNQVSLFLLAALLLSAALLLPAMQTYAQDSIAVAHVATQRLMTLENCLSFAYRQSYEAKNAKQQLRSSESTAEAARRSLYSRVDLAFDIPNYYSTLSPQFNPLTGRTEYYALESLQWASRLDISQPLIWTNSTLTLSGRLYRQDQLNDNPGGQFFRDYFTDLAIQLRQPLFIPNTLRISLRKAEIDYTEALSDYRWDFLNLRFAVTGGFYRLWSAQEQVRIQEDRVCQETSSYDIALRKFKSGLIAEVEALQFEVDLAAAKNDLLAAENTMFSRGNSFKILLGLPLSESLQLLNADTTFRGVIIDKETAIEQAKKTRVDLQRAKNNIERSELTKDEISAQRHVRGDLFLSYGLNKNDASINNLYSGLLDTRRAVFTLSIPVFDWGKHAHDMEAAEARLQISRLSADNLELTIEQEITDLVLSIESSARRAVVLIRSREVAKKAYDINTRRFESGTIGTTDLAQSQSRLLQARLTALEAIIEYNLALADIIKRTSFDYLTYKPVEIRF